MSWLIIRWHLYLPEWQPPPLTGEFSSSDSSGRLFSMYSKIAEDEDEKVTRNSSSTSCLIPRRTGPVASRIDFEFQVFPLHLLFSLLLLLDLSTTSLATQYLILKPKNCCSGFHIPSQLHLSVHHSVLSFLPTCHSSLIIVIHMSQLHMHDPNHYSHGFFDPTRSTHRPRGYPYPYPRIPPPVSTGRGIWRVWVG